MAEHSAVMENVRHDETVFLIALYLIDWLRSRVDDGVMEAMTVIMVLDS